MMSDLIAALQILLKYGNPDNPSWCSHDEFHICGIDPEVVPEEDVLKLKELGFFIAGDHFMSFRYGSA